MSLATEKKIACCVCTWHRPQLIGRLIECFRRQDYPLSKRELIILDDAGQYESQSHPEEGWSLVSFPRRFRTLGEKRNAVIALASPDAEYIAIWDDDDLYLPHALSASVAALQEAEWSRPSQVLHEHAHCFVVSPTNGYYQGGWAFRRTAIDRVGGYHPTSIDEDQELMGRLQQARVSTADPLQLGYVPFYVYTNGDSWHCSMMGDLKTAWEQLGQLKFDAPVTSLVPRWPRDYDQLPILNYPHQAGRGYIPPVPAGGRTVRICGGLVTAPANSGPTNGMYALQKALAGVGWLQLGGEPQPGELAWWWHFGDREQAAAWDRLGYPSIHGPNMLFTNSHRPRIDELECRLLDAKYCRAIVCHAEPYRQLIAQHLGPGNQAEFIVTPYPVDPRPPQPLANPQYDVLLYLKSGYSTQLVDRVKQAYPEHYVIEYGKYERSQLGIIAAASRACLYFSSDDHGPVALAEILLAGCPCIGTHRNAAFIRPQTGLYVLDWNWENIASSLNALHRGHMYARQKVAAYADTQFSPSAVLATLLPTLDRLRQT